MHNSYYDIEERLSDFVDFESDIDGDVIDDVWNGLENNLIVDNTLSGLHGLEADVPADVWNGIEANLSGRNRRPVLWWASGVAASLLLTIFTTSQLGEIYNTENTSISENSTNVENTTNNTLSEKINTSPISEVRNISNKDNVSSQIIDNNREDGFSKPNEIVSSSGENKLHSKNQTSNSERVSKISKSNFIAFANSNTLTSPNTNSIVEDISDKEINNSNKTSSNLNSANNDRENILSKNIGNNNSNDLNSVFNKNLTKTSSIEELIEAPITSVSKNILEKENNIINDRKWKLLALAGIGNYKIDEQFYEIVEPTIVQYEPVKNKKIRPGDKMAAPIVEEVESEDDNDGLNYEKFYVPATLSIGGEFAVSETFAIRSGISHTSINYYYEKYKVGNELQLNYLAVPVLGIVTIKEWNSFKISLNSGIRVEKLIGSRYLLVDGNTVYKDDDINKQDIINDGVNFATSAGIDLEFKITPKSSISLTPQVVKYISLDSQEIYNREKRPIWPELSLAYSFKF